MDSMRLWDRKTGKSLDKDVYRFSKGDVMATYNRVAGRITKKAAAKTGHAKAKPERAKKCWPRGLGRTRPVADPPDCFRESPVAPSLNHKD